MRLCPCPLAIGRARAHVRVAFPLSPGAVRIAEETEALRIRHVVSGTVEGCDLDAFESGVAFNELQKGPHTMDDALSRPSCLCRLARALPSPCPRLSPSLPLLLALCCFQVFLESSA